MSKEQNKKGAPQEAASEEKVEKVMTKYDRKMQRRKEEKEREERAKRISTGVTVAILLALVCLVLSFPIRTYISLNKTYVKVGDENVTRVEFDYAFYTVVNNYVSNNSFFLSYLGLDLTKDLSTQPYSANLSWQDYFEEMTVSSLRRNKALKADAKAAGFTYDVTRDYNQIVEQQKASAQAAGLTLNKYIQQNFGPYATLSRIKPYLEEALYVNEYYKKLSKDLTPAADEVNAKYDEDPDSYDSVDYRILRFEADLPTAPTELADPVDEAAETDDDTAYQPSEAEIAKAMEDAKEKAEAARSTVKTEGEQVTNIQKASTSSVIAEWLFDSSRKEGDVTVLEDSSSKQYYCVLFEKRYRDDEPTADVRILVADTEEEALGMYGTWNGGGATEAYFEELCDGEFITNSVADGGLVQGISRNEDLYQELLDWIFQEGRAQGNCEVVTVPDVASFVVYYVGEGQPNWYNTIENSLRSAALNEYVAKLQESVAVEDPHNNLKYLAIRAAEQAAQEAADAQESGESSEGSSEDSSEEN